MTIRHHLQMLQLPPVILLSFSVNYTNHFLQDGPPLAASPGIYHSCICICRIHEQVNRVSHELIQVAQTRGGHVERKPREHAPLQPARLGL